jgi:preprotein translocase subunit SecG
MYEIILMIHVTIAAALIGMVLMQQGKGGMGALGGAGGGSQTLFGSQGSGNFFTRVTAILATAFFITSLTLSGIAVQRSKAARAAELPVAPVQQRQQQQQADVPVAPAPAQQQTDMPVAPETAQPKAVTPPASAEDEDVVYIPGVANEAPTYSTPDEPAIPQ